MYIIVPTVIDYTYKHYTEYQNAWKSTKKQTFNDTATSTTQTHSLTSSTYKYNHSHLNHAS